MSPRHLVTVPDSDDDMVEEVNYLRKSKQGTKAVKKQTPKTHPPRARAGEASQSQSKGQRRTHGSRVDDPRQGVDNIRDMDTYQVIDGYEDNVPEQVAEEIQPQVLVRPELVCHTGITDHVYIDNHGPMVGLSEKIPECFTAVGRSGLCSEVLNMLQWT
jgi:hypothetical protein